MSRGSAAAGGGLLFGAGLLLALGVAALAMSGGAAVARTYRLPLPGSALRVSSPFGRRVHPTTHEVHEHTGLDLTAPTGTEVRSPARGVVIRVDTDGVGRGVINGNAVHIRDEDGLVWSLLHLYAVDVVAGETVGEGQWIGLSGDTGRSTGPHLHFQVAKKGVPIDPATLYPRGSFYTSA